MRATLFSVMVCLGLILGPSGYAMGSTQTNARSFSDCGSVITKSKEGPRVKMAVMKRGTVGCRKARKVWKRFINRWARNPAIGTVKILGFRCRAVSNIGDQTCTRVKGRSVIRGLVTRQT